VAKKKAAPKNQTTEGSSTTKPAKKSGKKRSEASPESVASALSSLQESINARSSAAELGYKAAGQFHSDITNWLSTGCTPSDVGMWGGWPRGRIMTIEGESSQGKTTMLESAMAQNEKVGGINILVTSEHSIDRQRMMREGLTDKSLMVVEVDTLEQGFSYIYDTLMNRISWGEDFSRQHPLVIGWDTPSNAQEQNIFDDPDAMFSEGMASKARKVRSILRSIGPLSSRLGATLFLLLQKHKKIGNYGGTEVDCGGGPKYNATFRMQMRVVDRIFTPGIDDRNIGVVSMMELYKSKGSAPPFRSSEIVIRSWDGVDNDASMYRFLRDVYVVDPCPVCGGKIPIVDESGKLVWKSLSFRMCTQCNGSGEVFRLIDRGDGKGASPTKICADGLSSAGNATQWRYIFGWPGEDKITTTEKDLRSTFDARPGLRTWLAEQCWRMCSKPEPAKFHPVE